MPKFKGRSGDLTWGTYDYPVTRTQWDALDGIMHMLSGLPKQPGNGLPLGFFCSQGSYGEVIIGINHQSVTVDRHGRINQESRVEGR